MRRNPGHGRGRTVAAVVPGVALSSDPLLFFFDFVDPGSYLVHEVLRGEAERNPGLLSPVVYHPLELRPPPAPLQDARSPAWTQMNQMLGEAARLLTIPFEPPTLIPWSRKAHELALHFLEAEGHSRNGISPLHHHLFRAHFEEGLDLGRVDVLVQLAERQGLDRGEVHAVLGVDRFGPDVDKFRRTALELGVRGVPTLVHGEVPLEGFPGIAALRRFLASVGRETPQPPAQDPSADGETT